MRAKGARSRQIIAYRPGANRRGGISGRLRAAHLASCQRHPSDRTVAPCGARAGNAAAFRNRIPMCGIAGYVSDTALAPEVLAAMTRSLAHRGPDADGFFTVGPRASRPPPALGHRHRRQSAADDAVADGQRRRDLQRRDLQLPAAARRTGARRVDVFARAGDTETLLAGWAAWGEGVVHASARHVRVRVVGRAHADAVRRARPPGRQAVPLRVGRRDVRLRFGVEGGARASGVSAAKSIRRRCGSTSNASSSPRRIRCCASVRKLPPGHTLTLRRRDTGDHVVLAAGLCGQAGAHRRRSLRTRSTANCARRSKACWWPTCRWAHS